MKQINDISAGTANLPRIQLASWPMLMAAYVYGVALSSDNVLKDGDSYWHIAAGRWILQHGAVPARDPFSHTMPGTPWTAHEWLSEVLLARAHDLGGWDAVVALSAAAFAVAIALLTRGLLRTLEPTRAVLFAALAVFMTIGHFLARPHVLVMPLLILWSVEIVRARQEDRRPGFWLIPVLVVWANMHAGFLLGICFAGAFALEAILHARSSGRVTTVARDWGLFLLGAVVAGLATPHGIQGYVYTWDVMTNLEFALDNITEWASPNFHAVQPLEFWLLGGLALILSQGLKLPWVRLALLLGLLHLSLKHVRNIELLGMLAPLIVAEPFAAQWAATRSRPRTLSGLDRISHALTAPAHPAAVMLCVVLLSFVTLVLARVRPAAPPAFAAPQLALEAVSTQTREGPVLNGYGWGGYLIYSGIKPFIDGRADMYGDTFFKQYLDAVNSRKQGALRKLLADYKITWTLLSPSTPAVSVLDEMPEWRRAYADDTAVIHVKISP